MNASPPTPLDLELDALESNEPEPALPPGKQIPGKAAIVPRNGIKLAVRTIARHLVYEAVEPAPPLELLTRSLRNDTTMGPYLSSLSSQF